MKKNIKVIGLLIIISSILVACNKDNSNINNNVEENNPTENTVTQVKDEAIKIDLFDDMMMSLPFANDVAGTSFGVFSAVITGEKVLNVKFNLEEEISFDINTDEKLVSLSLSYDEEYGYIFALSEDNKVCLYKVSKTKDVEKIKYNIDNADSIVALNTDLEGEGNYQTIVIVKSKEGRYYTDYSFKGETKRTLKEITRK